MNDEPTSANGRSGDDLSWAPPEPKPAGPPQPQLLKGDASGSEPNGSPSPDLGIEPIIEPAVVVSEDAQSEPDGSKKSRVAGAATLGVGAQIGAMQLRPGNLPHGGSPVGDPPVTGPGTHDFPYGPPRRSRVC